MVHGASSLPHRVAAGLLVLATMLVAVGVLARLQGAGPGVAAASPERPAGAGDALTLAWVGDTMLGTATAAPPDGGAALFADVAPLLRRADVAAGNLEGVLTTATASKCAGSASAACFAFRADPALAPALRDAGFDVLNLANNHAWDYGAPGQADTIAALERGRIGWTGTPGRVAVVERDGMRVAFVGYAPYEWAPSMHDVPLAQGLVRYADTMADVVVALVHAGAEGRDATRTPVGVEVAYGEDRGDTRAFAHALVDAGADLVLGSGPHVVRGIERYRDRLVAYSLGNFAGWQNFSGGGAYDLSGVLRLRVARDGRVLGGRWHALRLEPPGIPRRDGDHAAAELVDELGAADFGAAGVRLAPGGRLRGL